MAKLKNRTKPSELDQLRQAVADLQTQLSDCKTQSERCAFALDSSGDGAWDWNLQDNTVYYSDQWKSMLGYQPKEIEHTIEEWEKRVHPDDLEQARSAISKYLKGESERYENEHRLRCKDGSYIWILDRAKIVTYTEDGQPLRFIGTHIDITNRVQLEKELTHSKNLMQHIIENSNGAVAVHDRELNYIYVSQRYLDDYKVKERDVIGKHHYDVFPDLPQKWRDVHQRCLQGEVMGSNRDPYPREDGTLEWTRWECRPWYASDGSIGGIIVYTEVITDLVQSEITAKENEAKYRALFENMALASCLDEIIYDQGQAVDYRILEVNPAFEKITGLSIEEATGKLASELYGTGQAPFLDQYKQVAETGQSQAFEAWFEPIKKHLSITVGRPKPGFFSTVFNDITERKNIETELNHLKNQLENDVAEKTKELKAQVDELERFHEATIEREFRMKELQEEIHQLKIDIQHE